jgi:hypothetical protein
MGRAIIHQPWKTSAQVEFLAASGNGSVSIGFGEGHDFKGCGKNSPLHLILGGAALQRCGKSFALNPASAAEVMPAAFVAVFPQPFFSRAATASSSWRLQPLGALPLSNCATTPARQRW